MSRHAKANQPHKLINDHKELETGAEERCAGLKLKDCYEEQ